MRMDSNDIDEAYAGLGFAVVEQGVDDYKIALIRLKNAQTDIEKRYAKSAVETLEKFFFSQWCFQLTDGRISGGAIIKQVRRRVFRDAETEGRYTKSGLLKEV